jgi:hypothetical protein
VARRPAQHEEHEHQWGRASDAPSPVWEARLEIVIAIMLGLAAIVTAGSVYLNEHQEHEATLDFHKGTHDIVRAVGVGASTPAGFALEDRAERSNDAAENHQERAARYTLAEVILATSLFLFGVAGISNRWRIKIGAFGTATGVFIVALVVLASVEAV